jgi:beta-lactamase regulating signal transducer with metallopeptidase domain
VRSATRFYRVSVALGAAGAAVAMLAALVAIRSLSLGAPSAAGLLQACREVVFSGQTLVSALVLALAGIGLAVLGLAIRSTARHYRAQRKVLSSLAVEYETAYRGTPLTVFAHETPEAFCAGLLRPRVYLSSAAVKSVEDAELGAVIGHESHHCRRRDPLRILIVQVLGDCLFFLPVMRHLRERYCTLTELAADDAAIIVGADRRSLAAALLVFAESPSGVVGIAPERVDHLLGGSPRWELPFSLLVGGLVTLAGLAAIAMTLAHTAAPGALSIAALSAQACMIAMVVLPVMLGVSIVAITHRGWQSAQRG